MNKAKVLLTAATFLVAIGGAFASNLLVNTPAYIHKADYPLAESTDPECILIGECDGQDFPCEVVFTTPKQLWDLDVPNDLTSCTIELRGEFIQ